MTGWEQCWPDEVRRRHQVRGLRDFTPDDRTVLSCEGGQIKKGQFILGENPEGTSEHAVRFWDVQTRKEWIRGQKRSFMEEAVIAAKAEHQAIEPWIKELELFTQGGAER